MATFTKICFHCGREFAATHRLANLCSPDCRKPQPSQATEPRLATAEPSVVARPILMDNERPCARCGVVLKAAVEERKYCSSTCRRAMQRQRRRAMIARGFVEGVSLSVLRERDHDCCRICGHPVDVSSSSTHPLAATIDHVIALVNGGEHSYRNTQLAHQRCNVAKGAS